MRNHLVVTIVTVLAAAALSVAAVGCAAPTDPTDPQPAPASSELRATHDDSGTTTIEKDGLAIVATGSDAEASFDYLDHGVWAGRVSMKPSGEWTAVTPSMSKRFVIDEATRTGLERRDPAAIERFAARAAATPAEQASLATLKKFHTTLLSDPAALKALGNGDVHYTWGVYACIGGVTALALGAAVLTGGAGGGVLLAAEGICDVVCGYAP